MAKVVWRGEIEVEGELIFVRVYRTFRLPSTNKYTLTAETTYDGEKISINDHGTGRQHAMSLLKMNLANRIKAKRSREMNG